MRSRKAPPTLRALAFAVQAAAAALAASGTARADDAGAGRQPAGSVELGIMGVDRDSAKFGEYNGLDLQGARANASFDLRGGSDYDAAGGGADRWRITGTDLGTRARGFEARYARQGAWRIGVNYDELHRSFTDSYQSLWRGVGTTTLTLPAGYPAAAARTSSSGLANWNNTQAPYAAGTAGAGPGVLIPALVQATDIGTTRRKLGLGGDLNLTERWTASLSARQERKDGTQLTGMGFGGFRGALLPEPIDSSTTIVEARTRYAPGRDSQVGLGYTLSRYRNAIDSYTAENPFANGVTLNNRILANGAPDNTMQQWTMDGSWRFTPMLKLVVTGSHSTLKQDEPFAYQSGPGFSVPSAASNSREVQSHLLARLTARPAPALDLNAAYKFDRRDNRSPVRTYAVSVQGDNTAAPSAATTFNNVPLDRKQQSLSLDARYTLPGRDSLTGGLERARVERRADAAINPRSDELDNPFASARSDEDTFRFGYRHVFSDSVAGQVSYLHGRRRAGVYEEPVVNPPGSSANVGFYQEVPGFRQFFLNDRNRDKLRATAEVQASEALFVQGGIDAVVDRFPGRYGVKETGSRAYSLDATYTASEAFSFTVFVTREAANTRFEGFQIPVARVATSPAPTVAHTSGTCAPYTNAAVLPTDYLTDTCREWSFDQGDNVWTAGLGAKSRRLLGGRLTLTADLTYARARTRVAFTGGTYYSNGVSQNVYVPAENLPPITSTMTDLRLAAMYAVNDRSALKLAWQHRRLRSTDPLYDLFGITAVQAFIGPGIAAPRYDVNAVGITWIHTFR